MRQFLGDEGDYAGARRAIKVLRPGLADILAELLAVIVNPGNSPHSFHGARSIFQWVAQVIQRVHLKRDLRISASLSPTRRYMPRFRCAFIIPSRASMCTL
jgi:hypothetical protein